MITLWWGKQEKLYGNHCWPLPLKCRLATLQTRASNPVGSLPTRSKSVGALPEWVSINNCPNKALIQNANISSLFSMWNSHWCKWKYHVCRQCKRYLQHGSREGILPAVLRNLNHSSSSRTSGCGKKKKKSCTFSVWESHHPPSQNLLNWNRAVFQLPSWRSEETWWVLHGDREWGLSNKISYFLCVNKSVRIFLNDLSLVLYLRNAAFLMLMCRHADFSTTFITLWTGIQYPPLCQS